METLVIREKLFSIEEALKMDREKPPEEEQAEIQKKSEEAKPKRKLTDGAVNIKEDAGSTHSGGKKASQLPQADEVIETPLEPGVKGSLPAKVEEPSVPVDDSLKKSELLGEVVPGAGEEVNASLTANVQEDHHEKDSKLIGDASQIDEEALKDKEADLEIGDEEFKHQEEERKKREEEQRKKEEEINDKLKAVLPETKNLVKWHVASLGNNYELCLHPDPVFMKHCLLTKNGNLRFQPGKEMYKPLSKPGKRVRIFDYSKVHKFRVNEWSREFRKENELTQLHYTTLTSRFMDLLMLFTNQDLGIILDLNSKLDCFAFYRVMPTSVNDFKLFANQCVHIVQRSDLLNELNNTFHGKISFESLELDRIISSGDDLVSDLEIETNKKEEEERQQKRLDKMRRLEEKRLRKEQKEREERERLEQEQKAAEEALAREKENMRSPHKAALAAKLEREKKEAEQLEKEKQIQQEKSNTVTANSNNEGFVAGGNNPSGLNDPNQEQTEGGPKIDEDLLDANNMVKDVPALEEDPFDKPFENPYSESFVRISKLLG